MPTYTVDASVFLSAFNDAEPDHAVSLRVMERLQAEAIPLIAPALLLPEVAAAIGRGTGDSVLAKRFASALARLPHLVLVLLDTKLAQQAADVAARHHLRGADAVYVAVAVRFGSALLTLDREQHKRAEPLVTARYPAELLADFGG